MKIKIILATLLFSFFFISCKKAIAQTPSDKNQEKKVVIDGKEVESATNASSTDAIKDLILKKVAEQTESATNLEKLDTWRKAVFGQVEKITDDSVSISTKQGTFVVAINKDLSFKKNDKKIESKNIEIGNWALIIGTTKIGEKKQNDLLNALEPQLIYVYESSPVTKEQFVTIGTIKSFDQDTVTIDTRKTKEELKFFTKQTKFQTIDGKSSDSKNLEKDIAVLIAGNKQKDALHASSVVFLAQTDNSDAKQ